ncbi:MAG: rhodanese-like domain-containing protein [Dechloromonas sp.]|nr:rhodanese-like domain-containing protein [Dechloromonas sp.]
MTKLKYALAGVALSFSLASFAADWAPGTTTWSGLPDIKVTKLALYLTPKQAFDMKKANPKGVALFDVRTRAEAMYVGMATDADALVPFVEHPELMSDWDERRTMYKLDPNQDFVPELERRLAEMGLNKNAQIILLCRSGDRSSKAADRLQTAGYTQVFSVAEGFEGDRASDGPKKGQRVVNGWKNADLPWSYKLDKAKMYFPR